MNDNTILRIKVPAHLYESVKKQLTLKEGKASKAFGDWKVVKEKKAPKENTKKIEEVEETDETMISIELEKIQSIIEDLLAKGFDPIEIKDNLDLITSQTLNQDLEEVEDLKEYEVTYVYVNGQCYKKDDEGNKTRVDNSNCGRHDRRMGSSGKKNFPGRYNNQND